MARQARSVPAAGDPQSRGGLPRAVGVLWRVFTFPLIAFLIILEPVVRVFLAGFALLLTLMAFFWKLAAPPGLNVPFIGMLGTAIGCIAVLAAYYWVLRVLSA